MWARQVVICPSQSGIGGGDGCRRSWQLRNPFVRSNILVLHHVLVVTHLLVYALPERYKEAGSIPSTKKTLSLHRIVACPVLVGQYRRRSESPGRELMAM